MRSPRDPTRRNRNLGTPKSGHGQDNRHVIPSRWTTFRSFYEELTDPVLLERRVGPHVLSVFVEPTLSDYVHACTVDDITRAISLIPTSALDGIRNIILRQPSRRQQQLSSVWGRLSYWSSLGRHSGGTIVIEAQQLGRVLKWSRKQSLESRDELERLRQDGHSVTETARGFEIDSDLHSVRTTQLYRTLPHEVGHNADYLQKVENVLRSPSASTADRETLETRYFARPRAEREAFAHRFADEWALAAQAEGVIPFRRLDSADAFVRDGLDARWFGVSVP